MLLNYTILPYLDMYVCMCKWLCLKDPNYDTKSMECVLATPLNHFPCAKRNMIETLTNV